MTIEDELTAEIKRFKEYCQKQDRLNEDSASNFALQQRSQVLRSETTLGHGTIEEPRITETKQDLSPAILHICSMSDVSFIYNAVEGVDFGDGTTRPLSMTRAQFIAAINYLSPKPSSFTPFHGSQAGTVADVTPTCVGSGPIAFNIRDGSQTADGRVGDTCFTYRTAITNSFSNSGLLFDPDCDPDAEVPYPQQRPYSYGATALIDEQVNFGDVAIAEADLDSATKVWVSYSYLASATWNCSFGNCPEVGGGVLASGNVCCNVIAIAQTVPGDATSSSSITLSGPGWTTDGNLKICYKAPASEPSGCMGTFDVIY